jgi:hypothetical protein
MMPNAVDVYGNGVFFASDAFDSVGHYNEIVTQAAILRRGGLVDWATYPCYFHTKLYSFSFFAFGAFGSQTILAAEPVNLALFALILFLIFRIGEEVFNRKTALIASAIIALWPSFMVLTTQLLREPQFIAAMLTMFLVAIRLLTKVHTLRRAIFESIIGSISIVIIWLIRYQELEAIMAISFVVVLFVSFKMVRQKRILAGNMVVAVCLVFAAVATPKLVSHYSPVPKTAKVAGPPQGIRKKEVKRNTLTGIALRISTTRRGFSTSYPNAGSNLDAEVQFNSISDIIRYVPRAAEIGFLSPFPNMWFTSGSHLGRVGRTIGALETLPLYVLEIFALYALWYSRRRLSVWLMLAIVTIGLTALGLVVVNVGTIYRFRYIFVMLVVILGSAGITRLAEIVRVKRGGNSNSLLEHIGILEGLESNR